MRIGIVTTWFERGAAYVSRQYRDILSEQGNDVFIYARGGEKYAVADLRWDGDRVTWAKQSSLSYNMAIDLDDFERWVRESSLDAVIFNEQQWFPAILKARELSLLTIGYIDYYREDTIPLFAAYDVLFCHTLRHYHIFSWHSQCHYIPWGTDLDLFSPGKREEGGNVGLVFFHSAGMSPYRKGTDLALRAFRMLSSPAKFFLHIQTEPSGELNSIIDGLEKEQKLLLHVGDVPPPGLYGKGDVYVYPSRLDGVGLTIAEALASGLPVISSDWPPMNEFVDNESGMVVPVDKIWSRSDGYYWPQSEVKIEELAQAMQFYIDQRHHLPFLKKKARGYAEKHLDWRKNSKNMSALICSSRKVVLHEEVVLAIKNKFPQEDDKLKLKENSGDNAVEWLLQKHPVVFGLLKKAYRFYRKTLER